MRLAATNPMNRALQAVLACEVVVFGLAIPGMIQVSGLTVLASVVLGGGAALIAAIAMGLMPRSVGWALGWLTQLLSIGLGFAADMMFWVGAMFTALWVTMVILGRRIEAAQQARRG